MVCDRYLTIVGSRQIRKPWLGFAIALSGLFFASDAFSESSNQTRSPTDYRLGVGDKIQITVYDEADLNVTTTLSEPGVISYPFLGDLKLIGLNPKEVEQLVSSGLRGPYLVDPKVSVTILQYRPFYIQGEVKQSGGYPYQPGLTLRRAVSLAGGFTERASQTKISVIRDVDGKRKSFIIKLDDLIGPGDTITVEQSFF